MCGGFVDVVPIWDHSEVSNSNLLSEIAILKTLTECLYKRVSLVWGSRTTNLMLLVSLLPSLCCCYFIWDGGAGHVQV